jgi:hypothetical protein
MMIHKLYNPWHITNSGESETDKQFSASRESDENFYIIHQLRLSSRFHRTQMAGECDFLVLTELGVMVIEVKGGVIGLGKSDMGDNGYYRYTSETKKEGIKDPFIQVDGNADAVKKYLKDKKFQDVFVGSMACFPECVFTDEVIGKGSLWHRGHDLQLMEMIAEAMALQIEEFHAKQKAKGNMHLAAWRSLEKQDMENICNALKPEFEPRLLLTKAKMNLDESSRRLEEGLHVLHGLNGNRMLIVQGPPGSGKSTYAFDLITRLCNREGKKGLYLCWNELLAADMQSKLNHPDLGVPSEKIKVLPYFDLAHQLAVLSGDHSFIPSYEKISKGEMKQLIKGSLSKVYKSNKLEKYDFIVADEAQDLFDKGLDIVIKSLLKVNNPLQNGSYYIFYDDKQAYPNANDLETYIRTRDTFKEYAATYTLFSNLRSNTGHGIEKLILSASAGVMDVSENFGEDVVVKHWEKPGEAIELVKRYVTQEKTFGCCKSKDMAILFTADLLKDPYPFKPYLEDDSSFELLHKGNLAEPTEKTHYTSILKAKGLEWDVVFLVCSGVEDQRDLFQLFIGASRAKIKLYVLIQKYI